MSEFYSFNTSHRIKAVLEGFHAAPIAIEEAFNRYAEAVNADLTALVASALPHFFDMTKQAEKCFDVKLDKYDLTPNAKISPSGDRFTISISLGTILAIDDVTAILCKWRFADSEMVWDYVDAQYFTEPKFRDYSFLLDTRNPGGAMNFIYAYPCIPASEENLEYAVMAGNFAILWILLHEIGHARLGHLGELGVGGANTFDDTAAVVVGAVEHLADGAAASPARLKICQEFAADMFASSRFLSTFMREDAITRVFPRKVRGSTIQAIDFLLRAAVVPACVLHRVQKSVARGGSAPLGEYPDPGVRLFNILASVWPVLDNNRRFIKMWFGKRGYDHVLREFDESDIMGPITLNIGWIDRLFEYMSSPPLLPWKIEGVINVLPRKQVQGKIALKPVDPEIILNAEAEIAAAALSVCRGFAEFRAARNFSASYSEWKNIFCCCRDLWIEQLEAIDRLGPRDWGWLQEEDPDLHRYLVLSLFREIGTSIDEHQDNIQSVGEFRKLVAGLASFRSKCAPPTVPGSWHSAISPPQTPWYASEPRVPGEDD